MTHSVYFVANINVQDIDLYKEYVASAGAVAEKYGGSYIVRGGKVRVVEGEWKPSRFVIVKFESEKAFDRFFAFLGLRMRYESPNG